MTEPAVPAARTEVTESLIRGLRVIRAFDDESLTMTVAAAAQRTGLARAVVRRVLRTLVHEGYAAEQDGSYRLTPKILSLGFAYLSSLGLPEVAEPLLRQLSTITGESSSLGVLSHDEVVYVSRVAARRIMHSQLRVGARFPAHASSFGRVLLADLRDPVLRARLDEMPRKRLTPATVIDVDELMTELSAVRDQGWCIVIDELELGVAAVSAPVRDASGTVVAAVNVSMASGFGVEERVGRCRDAVIECAGAISRELAAIGARY